MKPEIFELERIQSLHENEVRYNLTESGIHPLSLREFLSAAEIGELLDLRLGYGYTNGTPAARQAVSDLYPGATADNVLISNGSAEANFVFTWRFLDAGDEIIVMLPNYQQIWGLARSLGVVVKPFPLREENGWKPDLDTLRQSISTRTRAIAICNPNNPTGAVLSRDEMREIASIADDAGCLLYADEVYRGAELDGVECASFFGMAERVIVAGGLSKAYALPGLRFGWLAGPPDLIAEAWAMRDYTTIAAGALSNHLAALVLSGERRQRILTRNREFLRRNLSLVREWCGRHDGLFSFVPPRAGGFVFLRHELPVGSRELTDRLRTEKSVFIVAGECFGSDRHIRIGLGPETDYLREGLALFDAFLAGIPRRSGARENR